MIHSSRFVAVLDANVLYSAPLRDFLLRLAETGLYKPKWTNEMQEEWMRNLLLKRPDLAKDQLKRAQEAMDSAFPDANITRYKSMIKDLSLPDKDDRHVLAAAIKSTADAIITFNIKDFPVKYVKSHNIAIKTPDEFIIDLFGLDGSKVLQAFHRQVNALKKPPQSISKVLETLAGCGLNNSILILKNTIGTT